VGSCQWRVCRLPWRELAQVGAGVRREVPCCAVRTPRAREGCVSARGAGAQAASGHANSRLWKAVEKVDSARGVRRFGSRPRDCVGRDRRSGAATRRSSWAPRGVPPPLDAGPRRRGGAPRRGAARRRLESRCHPVRGPRRAGPLGAARSRRVGHLVRVDRASRALADASRLGRQVPIPSAGDPGDRFWAAPCRAASPCPRGSSGRRGSLR